MASENTADVRNIEEGDSVTLETEEALIVEAECTKTVRQNAKDPNVVRETRQWYFETDSQQLVVQIVDGLRRFENQTPYPHHTPLAVPEEDGESYGYIEDVQIHGKMEA